MARTELPNGVILPAEYSDDWYEDMTSNLTKLDDVIGSDSEKLNADGVYFLRMSSAALTDSGTGNFSDLNSSYKIKTGDLVLDSVRKLYRIVSVDSANETFTVGNSLFKVTAESDLAPVAESGDYDDLDNKPSIPTKTSDLTNDSNFVDTSNSAVASGITSAKVTSYDSHIADTDIHVTTADKTKWNNGVTQSYVVRYASIAVSDNSSVPYTDLNNTDNIKANDLLLDTNGKLYQISSVDTVNETAAVTTPLTQLAVDSSVMHLSGNETCTGNKGFVDNIIVKKIVSNVSQLQINAKSNADSVAIIAGTSSNDGGGIWIYGKNSVNNSHVAIQVYDTANSTYHAARLNMDGALTPTVSNNGLGSRTFKWVSFNGINPGSLSFPDLNNALDISGYITNFGAGTVNEYTPVSDGWISIANSGDAPIFIRVYNDYGFEQVVYSERNDVGGTTGGTYTRFGSLIIPCIKNVKIYIIVSPSTSVLVSAKFFPCLGNV